MAANITLTGDKQVDSMLATLEPKLQKKAIKKGTREGAKLALQQAKRLVPIDTKTLLRSMTVRTAKREGGQRLSRGLSGHAVVHVQRKGKGDPFYAHFVEFGTKKWHGHRYIRKALYDSQSAIVKANRDAIKEGVIEIARKERMKSRA